ncbi:cell wall assembly/cell proliferation coordinating protein, KNR4-like protein [Aerococcaceae bacterium DSM 109653]|uniref:Cell wall assembly/cell proliferation coordinating protein, KNR4-like protein n=1 Tax=Fundicoccus ignavus TaxID=2664442 RepID=A0A6I2GGP1_9LACT|nr:SMI1/KNR4 family protein [Fundicoccus ignavus]MRI80933.1 cell wall assembly/cell proliferation coordinating protein, KNR4-like protein [Fundicoccus ignavus]MRI85864.1 cell wall assembly/cell proliferation coordinating protein, KNR4-like protein [Fundicoccus ignavus]
MSAVIERIKNIPDVNYKTGVSLEVIDQAETKLKVKFSKDYIEVLNNFGILLVNGHEIIGLGSSARLNVIDITTEERELNLEINPKWYVIEQANIDRVVIWQNKQGEIFQTQPEYGFKKIADSLLEYIQS